VAAVVAAEGVGKLFSVGTTQVSALHAIDLSVAPSEFLAIMGPSGSGKSTLLAILGCFERPSSGACIFEGEDTSILDDVRLSAIRSRRIGFVFQNFNLLPHLTVYENISLSFQYAPLPDQPIHDLVLEAATAVGLGHRLAHRPIQLSGGEQQRVAIARAIAKKPALILADEPTGNLDSRNGEDIIQLLTRLNDTGSAVVLVTHDAAIARHASRIVELCDGRVVEARHDR
jgi:putative ABC transport system ATP-binding protein